jgi:5-methyltetrahydropteroyltriglutamate--homocysteine methyltransferase
LLYPQQEIVNYPRKAFLVDLINEAEADIRGALEASATIVIDFTEARLSLKPILQIICRAVSLSLTIEF